MRNLILCAAAVALVAGTAGSVTAQPSDHGYSGDHGYNQEHSGYGYGQEHSGYDQNGYRHGDRHDRWSQDQGANHRWSRGDRMGYDDWSNARPVDYRAYHLRRPPHGYAWRERNGQFILAAVATGVVSSIILDNAR